MKAKEIDAQIRRHYECVEPVKGSCDGFVQGDPEVEVTGIVTTFTVTAEVMHRAQELGANMIVTHEPTFFIQGRGEWMDQDPVFAAEREMAKKNGFVVWRCHDMMHAHKPDDIYEGFIEAMGWRANAQPKPDKKVSGEMDMDAFIRAFSDYYVIEPITLAQLCDLFREKLQMPTLRISGDPNMMCSRIGVLVGGGSQGFGRMPDMCLRVMNEHKLDVVVCGEIFELLMGTYMQDAAHLGVARGMIVLGHERSEEWGMKQMQTWLSREVPVPVHFVDAKEPFGYL